MRKRKRRKKYLIIIIFVLFFVLTTGYSLFNTNLIINTKGNLKKDIPEITLDKITYKAGWDGWNLKCAKIDGDYVTLDSDDACVISKAFIANNEPWYVTFNYIPYTHTKMCADNLGTFYLGTAYYDENGTSIKSSNDWASNGRTHCVNYGEEIDDEKWDGYKATNVYKVSVSFFHNPSSTDWQQSNIKIWNFKFWGQLDNDFYLINVKTQSKTQINKQKYIKGNLSTDECLNSGIDIENNQIKVEENGIYTVCAKNGSGRSNSSQITINRIVK